MEQSNSGFIYNQKSYDIDFKFENHRVMIFFILK